MNQEQTNQPPSPPAPGSAGLSVWQNWPVKKVMHRVCTRTLRASGDKWILLLECQHVVARNDSQGGGKTKTARCRSCFHNQKPDAHLWADTFKPNDKLMHAEGEDK